MKAILVIALLLIASQATTFTPNQNADHLQKMIKDNKWSSIVLSLSELHLQSKGPLDELVNAIQDVLADLGVKLDNAYAENDRRTFEHNEEVKRIQGLINYALGDVAYATELLNNVLYVQRDTLNSQINKLNNDIETNKQDIERLKDERLLAHNSYLERDSDHTEALAAVEEALGLLAGLRSQGISLAEVKSVKATLDKVQRKLPKSVEASFVKALLALSSSAFADQDALQKVTDLLIQLQKNLQESQIKEKADDEQAQVDFENEVNNKLNEITSWELEINNKTNELARTEENIKDKESWREQRQYDQAQYEKDLVAENESWDRYTKQFEELVAQFESEKAACEEALTLLSSGSIAGYLGGRMEQDVVIDQYHGSQVSSADWSV